MRKLLVMLGVVGCCIWTTRIFADDTLNARLFGAVDVCDTQQVTSLISQGADPDVPFGNIPYSLTTRLKLKHEIWFVWETPLSDALEYCNKTEIPKIIARHMSRFLYSYTLRNGKPGSGSALDVAVGDNALDVFKILIQRGASVARAQADGWNLYRTVESVDMANLLLANGADPNIADPKYKQTALHQQAMVTSENNGNKPQAILRWLISHGASVNAKDYQGQTPLFWAVKFAAVANAKVLLDHGADVNAKDNQGNTPLHMLGSPDRIRYAQSKDWMKMAKLLLTKGANLQARNNAGATALDMVVAVGDNALATYLKSAGASNQSDPRRMLALKIKAFPAHPEDEALRASIIKIAKSLKPKPAEPDEAKQHAGRARYLYSKATTSADVLAAAKEYLQAIKLAPWVADNYYNLCIILKKTPYTRADLHACKLYLEATDSPGDEYASRASDMVTELRYKLADEDAAMKARTRGFGKISMKNLYDDGGLSGQVDGQNVALKMTVNWQAVPARYEVMSARLTGNSVYTDTQALVDTNRYFSLGSISMHLYLKSAGAGLVELAAANGDSNVHDTLDDLFARRARDLKHSPIYEKETDGEDQYFVAEVQGGQDNEYAGFAMYRSDCAGHLIHPDPKTIPDDFVNLATFMKDRSSDGVIGDYQLVGAGKGYRFSRDVCEDNFEFDTDSQWGETEK